MQTRNPQTQTAEPQKKGRPLEEGLRDKLLDHTIKILLRDGYKQFSMNAVAQSARASKETLYRHFGDKAGLLHAALIRNARLIGPLLHHGLDQASTKEDKLYRLGMNYLHGCYLPEALALQRIAYADGENGLGPIFAEEITEHAIAHVVDELALLGCPAPRQDAETFLGMIQGKLHEKILLGVHIDQLEAKLEAQVRLAVQVFMAYLSQKS